jgi:predicted nicotinamide N-methyase
MIQLHTEVAAPALCPEIRLHLITSRCSLWSRTEDDARAAGLPDPFWAFCWGGGEALARYVIDHPSSVRDKTVLDFGSGSGVNAIAAAKANAKHIVACDIDPIATEAIGMNAGLNEVALEIRNTDPTVDQDSQYNVVLAGDVLYDRELAGRVMSWLLSLAALGSEVLIGDPGRGHLAEAFTEPLRSYEVAADVGGPATNIARVLRLTPPEGG